MVIPKKTNKTETSDEEPMKEDKNFQYSQKSNYKQVLKTKQLGRTELNAPMPNYAYFKNRVLVPYVLDALKDLVLD